MEAKCHELPLYTRARTHIHTHSRSGGITPKKLSPSQITLTEQLPTRLSPRPRTTFQKHHQRQNPLPSPRRAGFGVCLLQWLAASAWQRRHAHKPTNQGTSTANAPWSGDRPGWHINAARTRLRRGASPRQGTYGTRRGPSRLCRGRSRRARATALPRSRLAAPPASFASRLAVLRKLAAERRRPPLRGVLLGRRAVLRPQSTPSPSRRLRLSAPPLLQAPVWPGSEQQGVAASSSCAPGWPVRGAPEKCQGEEIHTEQEREGSLEGTPTPPSASEGAENDQRTRSQIQRVQDAGKKKNTPKNIYKYNGCALGTEGLLLVALRASPSPLGSGTPSGWQPPVSWAHLARPGRGRSRRRGARTASARRGAGQHLPVEQPSSGGWSAGDAAASSACKPGGGRRGGEPSLPLPAPVSSPAPPPPAPLLLSVPPHPPAGRAQQPSPRRVGQRAGAGGHPPARRPRPRQGPR